MKPRAFVIISAAPMLALAIGLPFLLAPRALPDILLVTADTLRADALTPYGAPPGQTPHLWQLAADSLVYTHAAAPMPLTRPSHFSAITGLHPRQHGVLNNGQVLSDTADTLAERLLRAGYQTGGFVGVNLLGKGSGAEQGFDAFGGPDRQRQRRAGPVVTEALRWLDGVDADRPVFLWVHLFDPHQPYDPPAPFRGEVDPVVDTVLHDVRWDTLDAVAEAHDGVLSKAHLLHALRLYAGEVRQTDHWVGRLLDGFGKRRRLDDAAVLFTADHGECFENGIYFEHADCLYDGAIRVPLFLKLPGAHVRGVRSQQVSLVDVAPTLLQLAGTQSTGTTWGRSLLQPRADRVALLQQAYYPAGSRPRRARVIAEVAGDPVAPLQVERQVVAIATPDFKLIRSGRQERLLRLSPVPAEAQDVSAAHPDVVRRLSRRLDEELLRAGTATARVQPLSDSERENLRALGYVE